MRAFVALPLPGDVRAGLIRLQQALPVGRPVPEENLHLTLAFLGDVAEPALDALHEDLDGLRAAPVDLRLSGLETFGGRSPRGLAVSAHGAEALHAGVAGAVRAAGIVLEHRRFRPHVTIARFGRTMAAGDRARLGRFIEAHAIVTLPPFTLDQFALYRSDLHPDGARHEVLAEYDLKG